MTEARLHGLPALISSTFSRLSNHKHNEASDTLAGDPVYWFDQGISMVHIAFEIEVEEYEEAKELLIEKNIQVEKEIVWKNDIKSRSIYFRDPAGNLVEFITRNYWPVIEWY